MFTGIIEEMGVAEPADGRLTVWGSRKFDDCVPGSSVAINGVCLTVVELRLPPHPENDAWEGIALRFDISPETLDRTTLGGLRPGWPVNLERAVTLLTRLGGHLVQGHVDGVGQVADVHDAESGQEMWVSIPPDLRRYVVEKGSIAVDGVSLTVAGIRDGAFGVALVPHTLNMTALRNMNPGDAVNLEVDVVAKYIEGLLGATIGERRGSA
jgi:riboflavin synthase